MGKSNIYFKQLDGLRAVAVIMVFVYHWLPSKETISSLHLGPLGVSVFFVLSGFLISNILLKEKKKIESKSQSIGSSLRTFYARRTLRIFPVYYLFILFLFALNFESVRGEIGWHLLYGSNFLYFFKGEFSNGLSHLWSLCVEEQFYLIWPLFVFLVPTKRIKLFFISTIVLGIFSQLILANTPMSGILMITKIDAFGWGGLLAYIYSSQDDWQKEVKRMAPVLIVSMIGFVSLYFLDFGRYNALQLQFFHAVCFFMVAHFSHGNKGVVGRLFESGVMIYLGKISYGIYLYHNVMQWLLPYFSSLVNLSLPSNEYARFVIYLICTIIVSSISWYIIEQPINSLKKHFKYQ